MNLLEKIDSDLKQAMKAKDVTKLSTLRMLKSQIINKKIVLRPIRYTQGHPEEFEGRQAQSFGSEDQDRRDKIKELTDNEIMEIISKQIKQRNDSIKEYKTGNRNDLVEKEQQEIEVLKPYLPQQISDDEISKIVDDVIKETNASTMGDMDKVMGRVLAKTKGRADNSKIAQMVKSKLQ